MTISTWIDAIQAQAQTDHVIMDLREPLNTCRVADMSDDMMFECSLKSIGSLIETLNLQFAEIIKITAVTAHEMREYRARNHCGLSLKAVYKFRYVIGSESKTVHTGINLDCAFST